VRFFDLVSKDRAADEPILSRSDGARWNRSQQQRRMALALQDAGLDKKGTFYALRHSYISRAIEGEVPLNIIADNCGTSIRMMKPLMLRSSPASAGNLLSEALHRWANAIRIPSVAHEGVPYGAATGKHLREARTSVGFSVHAVS
jgi:integrase